jgi:hypothetical protein
MGNYESLFYEIYHEITKRNLRLRFDKAIEELLLNETTKHLSMRDKWSLAFDKITNER